MIENFKFKQITNIKFSVLFFAFFLVLMASFTYILRDISKKNNYSSELTFYFLSDYDYEKYLNVIKNYNYLNYTLFTKSIGETLRMELSTGAIKVALKESLTPEAIHSTILKIDKRFKNNYTQAYNYWHKNFKLEDYDPTSSRAFSLVFYPPVESDLRLVEKFFEELQNRINVDIKKKIMEKIETVQKINIFRYEDAEKFYTSRGKDKEAVKKIERIEQTHKEFVPDTQILLISLLYEIMLRGTSDEDNSAIDIQNRILFNEQLSNVLTPPSNELMELNEEEEVITPSKINYVDLYKGNVEKLFKRSA